MSKHSIIEIEPMVRDLWHLREREDLFLECLDYVEKVSRVKPIVVAMIDFLQMTIAKGGLSNQDIDEMAEYFYDEEYGNDGS